MRPEQHWQAAVALVAQIEQQMADEPTVTIEGRLRDLYLLATLHFSAAESGAMLAQHYPGRFAAALAGGADPGDAAAVADLENPTDHNATLDRLRRRWQPESGGGGYVEADPT